MENNFDWERLLSPSEEDYRRECLIQLRWKGKPACPHCKNSEKIYIYKKRKLFRCSKCDKQFSVTSGTNFHSTKLSLLTWFRALKQFSLSKTGVSSYEMANLMDITQPTAWRLQHRFRMGMSNSQQFKGKLSGTIECDETFVGGKNKNRHADKKIPHDRGRSTKGKTVVFGMLSREGKLFIWPVQKANKGLKALIRSKVEHGSNVATDEYMSYRGLCQNFNHGVVVHKDGNYANGSVHTNTIEGFWTWLKKGVIGVYYGAVKRRYLIRYCREIAYRYVTRNYSKYARMEEMLSDCLVGRYRKKGLYLL